MKKQNKVDDSLEFCKEIKYYEEKEHPLAFDQDNYPKLKEYIDWIEETEKTAKSDYKAYEEALHASEVAKKVVKEIDNPQIVEEELEKEELAKEKQRTESELPNDGTSDSKRNVMFQNLVQIIGCILIAFILVYSVTTYVVTYTRVHGESMEDTLFDGDVVVISRISYSLHKPEQFDSIVFQHDSGVNLVKRIIALPGQTVQITNGTIFVNGEVVNENFGKEEMNDSGKAELPITLGDDEYFVLGDNRNSSTDSRSAYVGLVKRKDIVGKVIFRIYPTSHIGMIR